MLAFFIGHSFLAHIPTQNYIRQYQQEHQTGVRLRFFAQSGAQVQGMYAVGPRIRTDCDVAVIHIGGNDVIPRKRIGRRRYQYLPPADPWDLHIKIMRYARHVR